MAGRERIIAGDRLNVWFGERQVGVLERRSESAVDVGFRYDRAWMNDLSAFPISTTMPLSVEEHEAYTWFMGLLPEAADLQKVSQILAVGAIDVFGLLRRMGDDLPGALEVREPGIDRANLNPRVLPLPDDELAKVIAHLPDRPLLVGERGVRMSLAGVQHKLAVVVDADRKVVGLPLDGYPSTHILKPRHPRWHGSVENEAFCLTLARRLKLNAAPCAIGRAGDIDYLLVKRYDRAPGTNGVPVRLHQEDLCQATGFPPYLKYEWDDDLAARGPSLKDCFLAVGRTTSPAAGIRGFLDGLIFNLLVGNVDAHSKNYSLVIRPGSVAISPLYDVMNGGLYEEVTKDLAMTIGGQGRGDEVRAEHWTALATDNGLSGAQVKRRVKQLAQAALTEAPKLARKMAERSDEPFFFPMLAERVAHRCRTVMENLEQRASIPSEGSRTITPPYPRDTHKAVHSADGLTVTIHRVGGGRGQHRRLDNPLGPASVGPLGVIYALDGERMDEEEWRRRMAGLST